MNAAVMDFVRPEWSTRPNTAEEERYTDASPGNLRQGARVVRVVGGRWSKGTATIVEPDHIIVAFDAIHNDVLLHTLAGVKLIPQGDAGAGHGFPANVLSDGAVMELVPGKTRVQLYLYASRAVQFHPHGGQSDFVWLSARTPAPWGVRAGSWTKSK